MQLPKTNLDLTIIKNALQQSRQYLSDAGNNVRNNKSAKFAIGGVILLAVGLTVFFRYIRPLNTTPHTGQPTAAAAGTANGTTNTPDKPASQLPDQPKDPSEYGQFLHDELAKNSNGQFYQMNVSASASPVDATDPKKAVDKDLITPEQQAQLDQIKRFSEQLVFTNTDHATTQLTEIRNKLTAWETTNEPAAKALGFQLFVSIQINPPLKKTPGQPAHYDGKVWFKNGLNTGEADNYLSADGLIGKLVQQANNPKDMTIALVRQSVVDQPTSTSADPLKTSEVNKAKLAVEEQRAQTGTAQAEEQAAKAKAAEAAAQAETAKTIALFTRTAPFAVLGGGILAVAGFGVNKLIQRRRLSGPSSGP